MSGIIDYIQWRGDLGFKASAFNAVDNLILSELAYMSFIDLLDRKNSALLSEIAQDYLRLKAKEDIGLLLTGEFHLMLELMGKSQRYGPMIIKECVEIIDEEIETQFSALTFEIDKNTAYIAFRGTDDTLVGWKEDFKMSFLDVVPAQQEALNYVNRVSRTYKYKKIFIGGHSKGGNLAVYAAIHAEGKVKKRLIKVYNNDGPGFKQEVLDSPAYQDISTKIVTLVPQSSIVGMLLQHEEFYQVIQSNQKGILQHDGFSWEVLGPDFNYLTDVDDDSVMVDMTIRKVVNAMTLKQREDFTNSLFDIISVNENSTLAEIKKNGFKSLHTMTKNYGKLDKETKKALHATISLFFSEGFRSFLEVKNADQWNRSLKNLRQDIHDRISHVLSK